MKKITEYVKNFKKYAKNVKQQVLVKTSLMLGISMSLTACGTTAQNDNNQGAMVPGNNNAIVQEIEDTTTETGIIFDTIEETTNENGDSVKVSEGTTENGEKVVITETINENGDKVIVKETTNENGETVKVTEKTNENGDTVIVTEKKDENGNVTEKTEEVTEPKTEAKTEPKKEVVTTTAKVNNVKTTTTTAATTKATPKVTTTTTTTAKPVTTTTTTTKPVVTQPPKTSYTKYDITSNDPVVAYDALENLSAQLEKELFNGYAHQNQYGCGLPINESFALIVNLNYNSNINKDALAFRYGSISEEDFYKVSDNINFAYYQYLYGSNVDFRKYVIDEDLANYINKVSAEFKECMNGNTEPLMNELNDYFIKNSTSIDNYIKYYFMTNTQYGEDYYCDEMNYARELFFENIAKKSHERILNGKGNIYTR